MHQYKFSLVVAATLTAFALAGCGGSGSSAGSQAPKIQFTSEVVFGDSLSDVGTYEVGFIAAAGGGRFTVNTFLPSGAHAPTNYTELLAAQLGVPAQCPAQTGLVFASQAIPYNVAVVNNPACTNYAQGGSAVTNPVGNGNAAQPPNTGFAMTVPLVTQIATHLANHGGKFSGSEVVLVLGGANDILIQFELLANQLTTPDAAGLAVGTAATELGAYVNQMILANGANYVVVMNIPDISTTPLGNAAGAQSLAAQAALSQLVQLYNKTLQSSLTSSKILYIDLFTVSDEQISNPSIFGLTNVSTPACNLNYPNNILATQGSPESGSSLACNTTNLIPGDVSHYEFADTIHPTPYGNILLARYVATQMVTKGWL